MALKIFKDSGISEWIPTCEDIATNIELFLSNQLDGFTADNASISGCDSSCSKYESECS